MVRGSLTRRSSVDTEEETLSDSERAPLTLALLVCALVVSLVGVVVTVTGGLDARTVAVSWMSWIAAVLLVAWPLSWGLFPAAPASRVVILVAGGLGFLGVAAYALVASGLPEGAAHGDAPGWGLLATSPLLGVGSIVGGVVGARIEGRAG